VGLFSQYVSNFKDYRISLTRYYGNGQEECDYSNEKTPNIELDDWGLFLWASRQYVERDVERGTDWLQQATRNGTVFDAMLNGVARGLEANIEPASAGPAVAGVIIPDSGLWEQHEQNAKHWGFSTVMAARGLCDFSAMASRVPTQEGSEASKHFKDLSNSLRQKYLELFRAAPNGGEGNGDGGYLLAAIERSPETDLDGAVAESFNMDVLSVGSDLDAPTMAHLEKLRLPDGGFMRVNGTISYQTNEWTFIDLRMAQVYMRHNDFVAAQALIDRVTSRAGENFNIIPEMLEGRGQQLPVGDYDGSIPMLGYGSGVYIMALLQREGDMLNHNC
jgi:GH15 family glucan-1,4-alpha-glucosidase